MKTFAMFIVFFFLAFEFVGAVEEIQPEAYEALPGKMVTMKLGNTFWGICRKIELEGSLPFSIANTSDCALKTAENHFGVAGKEALDRAKKVRAGEIVFFPYDFDKVASSFAAEKEKLLSAVMSKDREVAVLEARSDELKGAFIKIGDELQKRSSELVGARVGLKKVQERADELGDAVQRLADLAWRQQTVIARILAINANREPLVALPPDRVTSFIIFLILSVALIIACIDAMRSRARIRIMEAQARDRRRPHVFHFQAGDGVEGDFQAVEWVHLGCGTESRHPIQHLRNSHGKKDEGQEEEAFLTH